MKNETNPPLASNQSSASSEGFTTSGDAAAMSGVAETYRQQSKSGARWFFWVAALSMINSVVVLIAHGSWNFLAGLGITQVISGFALGVSEGMEGAVAVTVVALALDLMVALVFLALGLFAQKSYTWAFVIGMVIYALDGVIFLLVQEWLAVAFHAFVLYSIYRGLAANRRLNALKAEGLAFA